MAAAVTAAVTAAVAAAGRRAGILELLSSPARAGINPEQAKKPPVRPGAETRDHAREVRGGVCAPTGRKSRDRNRRPGKGGRDRVPWVTYMHVVYYTR